MDYTFDITITRECKRKGKIREVQGMVYSSKLGGCLFFLRKRKGHIAYNLHVTRMQRVGPPLKVQFFPSYIERDYTDRTVIQWIGRHLQKLVELSCYDI